MSKRILIIGGTGMLGQPVAHRLKEAGFQVRIFTRDRRKASQIFDASFEIVAGDPLDSQCLELATEDCDGAHISLPTENEQQVAEMVARVASRRGVQRISYISGATVAEEHRWYSMINRKFLAEKALHDSGMPYTIFCPTWVMEGLALFVRQGRAMVLGQQPCPYHWIAADDIAQMVAAAYRSEEAANKRFILWGPEQIRLPEALKRYCAVVHPDIKVSAMPLWLVNLLAIVMRQEGFKAAGEMMAYFDKVGEKGAPADDIRILGKPATTLDQWLESRQGRSSSPAR
jgi:uncharacterized protein YbjT (DUF2867 family)